MCEKVSFSKSSPKKSTIASNITHPTLVHFGEGRDGGHDDRDGHAELLSVVGERQRVVAGRGGNDALEGRLFLAHLQILREPGSGAAGELAEFVLEVHIGADEFGNEV